MLEYLRNLNVWILFDCYCLRSKYMGNALLIYLTCKNAFLCIYLLTGSCFWTRKIIVSNSRIFMVYYKSLLPKWDHLFWFIKKFVIWGMLLIFACDCLPKGGGCVFELKVIREHTKLRICLPKGDYFLNFVYVHGLTHLR